MPHNNDLVIICDEKTEMEVLSLFSYPLLPGLLSLQLGAPPKDVMTPSCGGFIWMPSIHCKYQFLDF